MNGVPQDKLFYEPATTCLCESQNTCWGDSGISPETQAKIQKYVMPIFITKKTEKAMLQYPTLLIPLVSSSSLKLLLPIPYQENGVGKVLTCLQQIPLQLKGDGASNSIEEKTTFVLSSHEENKSSPTKKFIFSKDKRVGDLHFTAANDKQEIALNGVQTLTKELFEDLSKNFTTYLISHQQYNNESIGKIIQVTLQNMDKEEEEFSLLGSKEAQSLVGRDSTSNSVCIHDNDKLYYLGFPRTCTKDPETGQFIIKGTYRFSGTLKYLDHLEEMECVLLQMKKVLLETKI